jgi:hypothetical protein
VAGKEARALQLTTAQRSRSRGQGQRLLPRRRLGKTAAGPWSILQRTVSETDSVTVTASVSVSVSASVTETDTDTDSGQLPLNRALRFST